LVGNLIGASISGLDGAGLQFICQVDERINGRIDGWVNIPISKESPVREISYSPKDGSVAGTFPMIANKHLRLSLKLH